MTGELKKNRAFMGVVEDSLLLAAARRQRVLISFIYRLLVLATIATSLFGMGAFAQSTTSQLKAPRFKLDPNWPKPLPNHWQIGPIWGLFADDRGLVWIANLSNELDEYDLALDRGEGDCCSRAPQVIAFNQAGDVVKSWFVSNGQSGDGCNGFKCIVQPHGIYVDYKHNVWVVGNGKGDSHIVKFDYDGKFLMQIGGSDAQGCCGNQDTENLGGGVGIAVWPATNELFVTDGYTNRRVIVFDADTGKFKRMWGAYGKQPPQSVLTEAVRRGPPGSFRPGATPAGEPAGPVPCKSTSTNCSMTTPDPVKTYEGPGPDQWRIVHDVRITPDGVVWVADRGNSRIQQFHLDGTFIRESFVNRKAKVTTGTAYGFAFSKDPDMKYVYVADGGGGKRVHILDRKTLEEIGFVGGYGGFGPGQFSHLHNADTDPSGNLYTGENTGRKVQRWVLLK